MISARRDDAGQKPGHDDKEKDAQQPGENQQDVPRYGPDSLRRGQEILSWWGRFETCPYTSNIDRGLNRFDNVCGK